MIQLQNQFRVPLPVEDAWRLLTDLPRVAGCMPGAALDEVVDGEYRGNISTRIGPISARYRGIASFREHDEVGHRAVIEARGREEKGNGSAQALITAVLEPDGESTVVNVSTELAVSGRAAQFGRSLLAEVSNSMVEEFVRRLEAMIRSGRAGAESAADGTPDATATSANREDEDNQLDVLSTLALPLARRYARGAVIAATVAVVSYLVGRGRRDRGVVGGHPAACYLLPHPALVDWVTR